MSPRAAALAVALASLSGCAVVTGVQTAVGGRPLHNRQLSVDPVEEPPESELDVALTLVGGEPILRCEETRHHPAMRITTRQTSVCRGCYGGIATSEITAGGGVLAGGIAGESLPATIVGALLLADGIATAVLAGTLEDQPTESSHLQPGYSDRIRACPAGLTMEYLGRTMPVRARGTLHRDDAAWLVNTALDEGGRVIVRFNGAIIAELPADSLGHAAVIAVE